MLAGEFVELGVAMAVGGENIFGIEPLTAGIALGLLHSFERVFILFLGFENCNEQWCRTGRRFNAQEIIGFARAFAATPFAPTGSTGAGVSSRMYGTR